MKTKILFVCMGNICRSPTAHAVMQHMVEERGIADQFEIESAGTHAYHVGEQSDARSRQTAKVKGIDMEYVRAQKISVNDYDYYDYILAMDEDNLELVNYYAPEGFSSTVGLFLEYANAQGLSAETIVPDPYYGGPDGFENVFALVTQGCDALINHCSASKA